ncbi:hypothetical protein AB0A60_13115 [Streptomyces sp. NPDC046275]|uniref:hypothetical protein n=1 Tax=Streptomyces sp. NPDC046275 TaxID=3157201 RepID=UPI0033D20D3A
MGVFALFRRKGKEAAESAAVTEETEAEAAEPVAESGAEVSGAEVSGAEVSGGAGAGEDAPVLRDGTVEIPRQQSAEEAADSGAAAEDARK